MTPMTMALKALLPACLFLAGSSFAQGTCAVKQDVTLTFFGLGSAGVYTRFGCTGTQLKAGSETASVADAPHPSGGDGSYANPALMATAENNPYFSKCEIIYIPYFKKYFQYGDICAQCATDFSASGLTHVDLWIGPNPQTSWTDQTIPDSFKGEEGQCEIAWGKLAGHDIVKDPPTTLEVQSLPLDDGTTCYNTDTTRFFPSNAGTCTGSGSSSGSVSKPPAPVAPSSTPAPASPQLPAPIVAEKTKSKVTPQPIEAAAIASPQEEHKIVPVSVIPLPAPAPTASSSPPAPAISSTQIQAQSNAPGSPCPVGGWFPGCVWGSGPGQIGDTCTAKTDCHGEWICVGGKCVDNLHDKFRGRRSLAMHGHGRGLGLGRVHARSF